MITVSCGIAMLGLLQDSPAVIIGAMLISPMMGSIMGLGFSLCIVDLYSMRRTLIALAVGTAWLERAGVSVTQRADYPVDQQAQLERDQGALAFQKVQVSISEKGAKVPVVR